MRDLPLVHETAVPLVLSTLLRRRQIPLPLKEVLLSSTQPHTLARILRQAQLRTTSKQLPPRSPTYLAKQSTASLLKDLPGFAPAARDPPTLQVVALASGVAEEQPQPQRRVPEELVALPLTLADVAELFRARHHERYPCNTGAAAVDAPFALLEGKRVHSVQRESFELYCGPKSKDLVIVETPAGLSSEDALWEALFVAECTLGEGGTLLAFATDAISPRVRRFLQWRFHTSHCAPVPEGGGHYALCSALAADFGAAAIRRDDFPGFLRGKQQRPRRWNPYRRAEARKFVVSVRPGFTNAPHTKDALLRNVAREKERDEQLRDADDAFFAVAHEMVEKGTHYSHPND